MMNIIKNTVLSLLCVIDYSHESNWEPSRRKMEKFVVGGEYDKITNYPHATFLLAICDDGGWSCGGSLLNQWIVLTAAHCVHGCKLQNHKDKIGVTAGATNVSDTKGENRLVQQFVVHADYEEVEVINDVALIKVDKPIYFGRTIKRIMIMARFPSVKYGTTAGWGITDEKKPFATNPLLKSVKQKLISTKTCKKMVDLHVSNFCAGSTSMNADHPSSGDSGSCLVTDTFTCMGVASYLMNNHPALTVFVNVSYYYDWIRIQSKGLYEKFQCRLSF